MLFAEGLYGPQIPIPIWFFPGQLVEDFARSLTWTKDMDLCSSAIFIPNLAPFKHHSDQHTVKNGLSQTVFSIWLSLVSSVSGMKLLVFDPELVLMLQDSVCV